METIAANAAIEQRVRRLLSQGYASKLALDDCRIVTICLAVNRGDGWAVEMIEHGGRQLGKVIALSINLFNPQKVVLAGEITGAHKILLPPVQRSIDNQVLKAFREKLPLVISALDHAPAIGAFALVSAPSLTAFCFRGF